MPPRNSAACPGKMLEVDGPGCGVSAQVLQQVRDSHLKA
jgi:hypothetical protein